MDLEIEYINQKRGIPFEEEPQKIILYDENCSGKDVTIKLLKVILENHHALNKVEEKQRELQEEGIKIDYNTEGEADTASMKSIEKLDVMLVNS